eukprot:15449609-Alexandrium_andersonii.AAC.1
MPKRHNKDQEGHQRKSAPSRSTECKGAPNVVPVTCPALWQGMRHHTEAPRLPAYMYTAMHKLGKPWVSALRRRRRQ